MTPICGISVIQDDGVNAPEECCPQSAKVDEETTSRGAGPLPICGDQSREEINHVKRTILFQGGRERRLWCTRATYALHRAWTVFE
ncbi:hypothetical protein CERZMDRAFT_91943 [Cercospora zeae-maydis SCOH1-5]|uniref:Uncharacterized protein n=1 Tax=Cercospora zeae-maydis SCOH1-5 TaxID=717836 RepID=A0A6A6EYP6_9PEZI|nr:hypothetical protein CERZMDRAFT_91943 [Cercospora zeae-maydis SCOH1-5]